MIKLKEYKVFPNSEKLANYALRFWKELQERADKNFIVSAPLSSTPLPLYKLVVEKAKTIKNWEKFKFLLMDEQVDGVSKDDFDYISESDQASYEAFAKKHLLKPLTEKVGLNLNEVIVKPPLNNLDKFEVSINLLIIAIGVKGHYAQVMPGTPIETSFHIAKLIPELKQSHTNKESKTYAGAKFRDYGMSIGHQQVLNAQNIIVIITGEDKRELFKQLMSYNSFDEEFPISIIFHPNARNKTRLLVSQEVTNE